MTGALISNTGVIKNVKIGFSWTTLFFGGFVPLVRGDLKWFVIMWISAALTLGIAWIIWPFFYNKIYIKDLIEKGYRPQAGSELEEALIEKGIISRSGR